MSPSMVSVLQIDLYWSGLKVSEFKLQSYWYIHFQTCSVLKLGEMDPSDR